MVFILQAGCPVYVYTQPLGSFRSALGTSQRHGWISRASRWDTFLDWQGSSMFKALDEDGTERIGPCRRFDEHVLEMPKLSKYMYIYIYQYIIMKWYYVYCIQMTTLKCRDALLCYMPHLVISTLELTIKKYWVSWSIGECLIVHTLLLHELRRWTNIYQWTLCT